jgi:diaminopimelate epimerase
MRIRFTKMQGAGNDFVVLDETRGPLGLTTAHYRFLADRHFGVGADQILTVRPSPGEGIDFEYVIHNADGGEVEQCGNGARCFVRFMREQGLTAKDAVKVKTRSGVIELRMQPDGRVTVNMGAPVFELARIPFDPAGLVLRQAQSVGIPVSSENRLQMLDAGLVCDTSSSASDADADADVWPQWPLTLGVSGRESQAPVQVAVVSMGNPHAVQIVADVDSAPVLETGGLIEHHPAFPKRVNAGFMQIVSRSQIRLRVYERGAGETLACGTGACAAVVAGIRLGLLDSCVDVLTRGGQLTIEWSGALDAPVMMTGPATTVFSAEIDIPDTL